MLPQTPPNASSLMTTRGAHLHLYLRCFPNFSLKLLAKSGVSGRQELSPPPHLESQLSSLKGIKSVDVPPICSFVFMNKQANMPEPWSDRVLPRWRSGAGCSQHWSIWDVCPVDTPGEGQRWKKGRGTKESALLGRKMWLNSISLLGQASAGYLISVWQKNEIFSPSARKCKM